MCLVFGDGIMGSQCRGITKSGTQCKMTGVFPNGYCRLHQSQYSVEIEQDTETNSTVEADEIMSSREDTEKTDEPAGSGDDNPLADQGESIQKKEPECGCYSKLGTLVCTILFFAALFQLLKKLIKK